MKAYAPQDEETGEASPTPTEIETDLVKCDLCSEHPAVCFCLNCEQRLCDEHFKVEILLHIPALYQE